MKDWLATLHRLLPSRDVVRVCVAAVRGSAPREAGACMLLTDHEQHGTIGGGHLEHLATDVARAMLAEATDARLDRLSLGATLGQCCGGAVDLWFERYTTADVAFVEAALARRDTGEPLALATTAEGARIAARLLIDGSDSRWPGEAPVLEGATYIERLDLDHRPLWIFGAGHVASALVPMLAPLPFAITWVDSREAAFVLGVPPGVEAIVSPSPQDEVVRAPRDALFLVMTHSHDQDFDICRALLARDRLDWAGLIGSIPKRTRFRQRLEARGIARADFERITCPIGIPGLAGKRPAEIAISVAAQVLQVAQARHAHGRIDDTTRLPSPLGVTIR